MRTLIRQTTKDSIKSLKKAQFWLIIASLTLLCFLSGPFGTLDTLPGGLRLIYWGLIVFSTGLAGVWADVLIRVLDWRDLPRTIGVAMAFGMFASAVVVALSFAILDPLQRSPGVLELFFYSFPSATIIFLFVTFFNLPHVAKSQITPDERPALFKRLKTYQAAEHILALRAQDHYVDVITEQGSELCLVRLNDAISETAPTIGVQIHRSHWVAISAIKKLETKGTDLFVRMTDGTSLKVSQSRIKELRDILGQGF